MRVFDTYWFNIADKVKFKDTQPYLKNMLEELGFSWSDIAFSASTVSGDPVIAKTTEKFPKLKKYYHSTENGPMVCNYTENRFNGELFADKSDYDDIFTLFSKIPRPFNIPFGHILLNGVNSFGENTAVPVPDWAWEKSNLSMFSNLHFFSDYIAQHRSYDDGLKHNNISVCIEVTADPEPRDSSAVIEKLIPYLGKPVSSSTNCVFSKEDFRRYRELSRKYSECLRNLITSTLPNPEDYPYTSEHIPPIPHLADLPTMKKTFAGTGFTHKKGNPGWLGEYDCRDSHGHLYQAYIQKLSSDFFIVEGDLFFIAQSGICIKRLEVETNKSQEIFSCENGKRIKSFYISGGILKINFTDNSTESRKLSIRKRKTSTSQKILEHPGTVYNITQWTDAKAYAHLDMDADGKVEEVSLDFSLEDIMNEKKQTVFSLSIENDKVQRSVNTVANEIYAISFDGKNILLALKIWSCTDRWKGKGVYRLVSI